MWSVVQIAPDGSEVVTVEGFGSEREAGLWIATYFASVFGELRASQQLVAMTAATVLGVGVKKQ